MSKFIFLTHRPFLPKMAKGQKERTHLEIVKLREKTTKKEIREYFKSHHIKKDFRAYAEYFIIDYKQKQHNEEITHYEYRTETYKRDIKNLNDEIWTLKDKLK